MTRISLADLQARAEKRVGLILRLSLISRLGKDRQLPKGLSASVKMVSRVRMTELNDQYRRKRRPTDVLSFPALDLFQKSGILGDLVVCAPVLRSQAKEIGHSVERELDVLLVHGVLHLLGLDHERSQKEAQKMALLENRLLTALNGKDASSPQKLRGLVDRA